MMEVMKHLIIYLKDNSYSPIRNYSVACIVEMIDGKTFEGVNVENQQKICELVPVLKKALYDGNIDVHKGKDDDAVILHSGGTTGSPKGIVLSNGSFNAMTEQIKVVFSDVSVGDRVLGILPIFHGFGLGICIHTVLFFGGNTLLLPKFIILLPPLCCAALLFIIMKKINTIPKIIRYGRKLSSHDFCGTLVQ